MAEYEDSRERIERLVALMGGTFRRRFLETISSIRDKYTLEEIEDLLNRGRFDEALVAAELSAAHLASAYATAYVASGADTARFLSDLLSTVVSFDQTNDRAIDQMRLNQLRLIREFAEGQRLATRTALLDGIARGLNPRQQALLFRASIGLTQYQVEAVQNYRRLLEANSGEALRRALRDGRFDSSLQRAINSGEPLGGSQIDRMVERYRERMLAFRAETIARTEALRSVHEGVDEAFKQASEQGILDLAEIAQRWWTARDERVRSSHAFMHGQVRPIGQPFLSGNGNLLRYPGDPEQPASDTVKCRCIKTTRFFVDLPVAA